MKRPRITPSLAALALALFAPLPGAAETVILDYRAKVHSVTGAPFGLAGAPPGGVTGLFVYSTEGAIDTSASAQRGTYQLAGGGAFLAKIDGRRVTGSSTPQLQVENFGGGSADTFRFRDGGRPPSGGGTMAMDGVPDEDIALTLSISDVSGAAFPDDSLPGTFPLAIAAGGPSHPHTFTLRDGGGSLVLQLESIAQRRENVFQVSGFELSTDGPSIAFDSRPGARYRIEFSAGLVAWQTIAGDLPSGGYRTCFVDTGLAARPGARPGRAFYRVVELGGD